MKKIVKILIMIPVTIILILVVACLAYFVILRNNNKYIDSEYEKISNSEEYEIKIINNYEEYLNYKEENEYYSKELSSSDFEKDNYIFVKLIGYSSCSLSTEFKEKSIDSNNNVNIYYDGEESCGVCPPEDVITAIPISKNININSVNIYFRIINQIRCTGTMDYKPIIYIYPKEDMNLNIKLLNNDLLTHTYPKYTNEWNVKVSKNGNIYDYETKRNYYALYWEGIDNTPSNMNEGFVVEGKDTIKFLEEKLEYLGLNEREINEFIIYWIDKLENNKYNFIRFRTTEEVNEYMPLEISVKPDTLIRIIMDFKPLENKIEVTEQHLSKVTREGYTIVEWGGREIK